MTESSDEAVFNAVRIFSVFLTGDHKLEESSTHFHPLLLLLLGWSIVLSIIFDQQLEHLLDDSFGSSDLNELSEFGVRYLMTSFMQLGELFKELNHLDAWSSIDNEDLLKEKEAEWCLFILRPQHVMFSIMLEDILHNTSTLPVEL